MLKSGDKRAPTLLPLLREGPISKSESKFHAFNLLGSISDTRSNEAAGWTEIEDEHNRSSQRCVYIGNSDLSDRNQTFSGNSVRTSKYTVLTFLPRNLFEQFHRLAYIYFLTILILNQIPVLAVFGRTASLFPLLSVLFVTAVKDAYEDFQRWRSDNVENSRICLVQNENGIFVQTQWSKLRVGDVVKLHDDEMVPCDLVLLNCSDCNGRAFIETANLDGETNLKTRHASAETIRLQPETQRISGIIICELPNRNIYEFNAYLLFDEAPNHHIPLGPNSMLYRGSQLRNTGWIVGVAVYTGHETKAVLNSSGAQSKRSRLENHMNRETIILALILFLLCLIGAIGMGVWIAYHDVYKLPYFGASHDFNGAFREGLLNFFSCLIVFQVMVPISLYISIELVRLGQSYFMQRDVHMYHELSDTPLECRALNVNEDLGQVSYIFSDKTGTLTENRMEYRASSIAGSNYVHSMESMVTEGSSHSGIHSKWKPKAGSRVDNQLILKLQNPNNEQEANILHHFFLVLAICNTIIPTKFKRSPSGNLQPFAAHADEGGWVEYEGESPDEQALVNAAASYGYCLLEHSPSLAIVSILNDTQRYEILGVHEFDNVRRRMSAVVKCPDGSIKLLVKGADSEMLPIISTSSSSSASTSSLTSSTSSTLGSLPSIQRDVDAYSKEGLRTLVIGMRELDEETYIEWIKAYKSANTALTDRTVRLQSLAVSIEKNLTALGATAIEDKLQNGVPETIQLLQRAGIKIWVLTGDKQETAISIAVSCHLITHHMHQIIINAESEEECHRLILDGRRAIDSLTKPQPKSSDNKMEKETVDSDGRDLTENDSKNSEKKKNVSYDSKQQDESSSFSLIIDGMSLVYALSPNIESDFYELATRCKAVVCCRVAPLQKAGVVSLVKRRSGKLTLAIGDGANDVSMIQNAHVGVGISGQEGRQAVMASDFAMAQFRFLSPLLLIHGHWNYQRISYMILYNFYRNAVFVILLFWFILYCGFSSQTALGDWTLILYTLLFTSIPTILIAILDQNVSSDTLTQHPALYSSGTREEGYNPPLFWLMMVDMLWQSCVIFFVPVFSSKGGIDSLWVMGQVWALSVVLVATLHLAMDVHHWTFFHHASVWGSLLLTFVSLLVIDRLSFTMQYLSFTNAISKPSYWLEVALIVTMALLPRFVAKYVKQTYFPNDLRIAYELERFGKPVAGSAKPETELSEVTSILTSASPHHNLT